MWGWFEYGNCKDGIGVDQKDSHVNNNLDTPTNHHNLNFSKIKQNPTAGRPRDSERSALGNPKSPPFFENRRSIQENYPRNNIEKIQDQQNYNLEENDISDEVSEIYSNMSESISNITFEEDLEILRRKATDRMPSKLRNRHVNKNFGELILR
ncbi:hypothetical protein R6Q57_010319 [Mikania cordata]